jgi:hypothetical protein
MDMIQVYAWLIASLIAALFFLFLLWLTVQQALQQHFSASVAAAIVDLISGSLTVVFFNNWNKANQHLSVNPNIKLVTFPTIILVSKLFQTACSPG